MLAESQEYRSFQPGHQHISRGGFTNEQDLIAYSRKIIKHLANPRKKASSNSIAEHFRLSGDKVRSVVNELIKQGYLEENKHWVRGQARYKKTDKLISSEH